MGSAPIVGNSNFRKLFETCANRLKIWCIRMIRTALDRADECVHAQEVSMREEAAKPAILEAVDPQESRKRERKICKKVVKPVMPRLHYRAGVWEKF
jgi:hypothetical protein